MHILPRAEGFDESSVLAEVRHQTQLDLRVVGTEEGRPLVGDEGGTDGTPFGSADRDVLDVGVAAGETAGGSDGLIERRMDLAIRVDERRKGFDIGAEEFLHATVVKDLPYDRVLVTDLL